MKAVADVLQQPLLLLAKFALQAVVIAVVVLVARIEFLRLHGRLAPDAFTLFSHQGNNPRRGYHERVRWLHRVILTNLHTVFGTRSSAVSRF